MTIEKPKTEFIIIHDTTSRAWRRASSTFLLFVSMIGIGVVVGSVAMQWAGFFIAVIVLFSRVGSSAPKRMTRDEAIAFLRSGDAA